MEHASGRALQAHGLQRLAGLGLKHHQVDLAFMAGVAAML
jgi:hypothetical protein